MYITINTSLLRYFFQLKIEMKGKKMDKITELRV